MFTKNTYLIREHVSALKLTDRYDIIDPELGEVVAHAQEQISGWLKFLRLVINKNLLPTNIQVKDQNGALLYYLKKSPSFLRASVTMFTGDGRPIGYMRSRVMSIGGAFDIYSNDNRKVAELSGNWTGWEFNFRDTNGNTIGTISKKWGGIAKELLTTADTYAVQVGEKAAGNEQITALLILGGLAVDAVYKEN
ncbi:MAG: phospholipid scramblase-related protein [Chitinophagales bacterium]|nr:phospholipid scramblase-related protein [Chitinophagales bacterium]MDW8420200.1 phospholipid scramblase-related protein [Chitinophagales bacterium]